MKHQIKQDAEGLMVEISGDEVKRDELLAEFQACREGRCTCPTNEYEKLESLKIEAPPGKIRLKLKAKSGQMFEQTEIEKCLEHADSKHRSKT